jgi:predicted  nucleic acid-binding Zn-ribbon protein
MQLSEENIKIELDKIEKTITATDKKIEKLIVRVEEISKENGKLSSELNLKREKITENRELISSLRADLSFWTE